MCVLYWVWWEVIIKFWLLGGERLWWIVDDGEQWKQREQLKGVQVNDSNGSNEGPSNGKNRFHLCTVFWRSMRFAARLDVVCKTKRGIQEDPLFESFSLYWISSFNTLVIRVPPSFEKSALNHVLLYSIASHHSGHHPPLEAYRLYLFCELYNRFWNPCSFTRLYWLTKGQSIST